MKRLFTIFLIHFLVLSAYSKSLINGIYYNLDKENHTAKVTNGGNYSGTITIPSSVIEDGMEYLVTAIGESAFKWSFELRHIFLPNSISTIESEAFYNCLNLEEIIIPNSVITIGYYAFAYCIYEA